MSVINAQIGDWLGIQPPATETEILQLVEGQFAPSIVKRLIALGLQRSEIDQAIIPLRTLQHRRSRREKLTVEESDRVMRLIRILSATEAMYGNRERALTWLRTAHSPAGRPHATLASEHGYRQPDRRRIPHSN